MSSISCHFENNSFVVTLPTTVLYLTEDEVLSLYKRMLIELLNGFCDKSDGKEIDDTIHIASSPISRSDAWRLYKSIDRLFSSDEGTDLDGMATSPVLSCDDGINWKSEGF